MKYSVWVKDKPEERKVLTVTKEDFMERYGKIISPSRMFVKDLSCRKGLFEWSDYNNLRIKLIDRET